jgi:hypothetical protein
MNKVTNKLSSILMLISFSIIHSCTTLPTKPNIPYSGFHFLLDEMSKKNNLLSIEIRKIPELTDGISPEEESALKNLIKLYNEDPDVFDFAFEEMYQEGLPDIRRYCTPLQALFWLMQDCA